MPPFSGGAVPAGGWRLAAGGRKYQLPGRTASSAFLLCLALLTGLLPGCRADPRQEHAYSLAVPAGWRRLAPREAPLVPGKVLEAYEVPAPGAPGSLVVLRSSYLPATTADQLLVQTKYLVLNLPSLEILSLKTLECGGKPAVLAELTALGTGRALSPTALGKPIAPEGQAQFPTRRLWLRIPRDAELGTLEVLFHCPEAEYARLAAEWEAVMSSLRA